MHDLNHDVSHDVSRRAVLAGAAALGAASVAGLPQARAAGSVKTLRLASGEADGVKGTLDPAFGKNDPDLARVNLVFERLVTVDDKFNPQPQLALEWTPDQTGAVWTFKLRPGVKFQDGTPFTAKDVIFTFQRLVDPKLGSPAAANFTAIDPQGIIAIDDLTVAFKLKQPVVEFPLLIANHFPYIVRAGQTAEQLRTAGIGTGPFRVERYVPGEEPSTFTRNEYYWQPGRPGVDRVELRSISEEAARIAALVSGQVDLFWDLPVRSLKRLAADPHIKVQSAHTPFWFGLAAWSDTPPYNDPRVRLALKLVANREQLLAAVLGGHGTVGNDTPVAPWVKYALQDEPRRQDIEKAKALLTEAGHPNGIDLELYTSAVQSGLVELATAYKAQAEAAGIRITINQAPADDYWANIWLKKPFIVTAWQGRAADEALSLPFLSNAEWNESHWRSKEFDALVFEARRTLDEGKRAELYQQAQRLLRDDGGTIVAIFGDAVGASRANVKGWTLHPQKLAQNFSGVTIDG